MNPWYRSRPVAVLVGLLLAAVMIAILTAALLPGGDVSVLERLSWAGAALGPVVIVGSAYFVLRQVQEAADAVRGQLFDATAGRIFELSRLFVEHPELRPFFYDGKDVDNVQDELKHRVLAAAELHIDFLDSELLRQHTFSRVLGELPGFEPWIRGLFRTSPAMRQIMEEDLTRGDEGWYDRIRAIYIQREP